MASVFKVTWFFEGRGRGWTESLWLNAPYDEHEKAEGPTARLAERRANLLGLEAKIKAYRISKEGVGPDSYLVYKVFGNAKLNLPGEQQQVNLSTGAAQPNVALLMRCQNAALSKNKFIFLRGIPDRVEARLGVYEKDLVWDQLVKAYVKELTAADSLWGWMSVKDSTKKSRVKLTLAESNQKGQVTFQFAANIFPNTLIGKTTKVRMSGVNKVSAYNGVHVVMVNDEQSCITVNPLGVGPYYFGGFGAWSELEFVKIGSATDQKIVTRKAGAPLLESRGRARVRPRA